MTWTIRAAVSVAEICRDYIRRSKQYPVIYADMNDRNVITFSGRVIGRGDVDNAWRKTKERLLERI